MNYAKAKRALKRGHTINFGNGKKLVGPNALADFVYDYDGKCLRELLKNARIE